MWTMQWQFSGQLTWEARQYTGSLNLLTLQMNTGAFSEIEGMDGLAR